MVVVAFALFLSFSRGSAVTLADLRVGDCLFVRTDTSLADERPIGEARVVIDALLAGRAERADCGASHGHEVSALVDLSGMADPLTHASSACRTGFEAYVGRPLEGSRYGTFAAFPPSVAEGSTPTLGVCLVARADGQWMDHPARRSGE